MENKDICPEIPTMDEWYHYVVNEARKWQAEHPLPAAPAIVCETTVIQYETERAEYQQKWAEHIRSAGTLWWRDRGFLVIWPEDDNESLSFIRLQDNQKGTEVTICH